MSEKFGRAEVEVLLKELSDIVSHQECWTCDCLRGFLVQLEMDAAEDVSDLVSPLKIDNSKMHGCLGCEPCPPAEAFSRYIRRKMRG
jgi:hypothetical protein